MWMHSRGIFCCQKKRDRLNSFFPTQVPAPHLTPLCALEPLWIKTKSCWDEGKDRELQKFLLHSPGVALLSPGAVEGLSPPGAGSRALAARPQGRGGCCSPRGFEMEKAAQEEKSCCRKC